MIRFILLLASFVLISQTSFACSCGYSGGFVKVSTGVSFVALVKVKKYLKMDGDLPLSMQVEVIEIYKGKEKRKTLTVWGDDGKLCRPYLSKFKKGQYYVIAFVGAGKNEDEKSTDYAISNCGSYWLQANNKDKTVTGDIESNDRSTTTMKLSELKTKIR